MIAADTSSLDCLATRGMLVSFGNTSGAVPPFEPSILSAKGSFFFTRPSITHYTRTAEELQACAADFFAVLASGTVKITVG